MCVIMCVFAEPTVFYIIGDIMKKTIHSINTLKKIYKREEERERSENLQQIDANVTSLIEIKP